MTTTLPPKNLLLILSDEHNPKVMGCAGHSDVLTPNLDRLAAKGTRFLNATCASPICVPTRAALATGRNVFEIGYWDNVDAYDGQTPSWHHVLRAAGHEVVSIGKLHYRGWQGDDYGFSESLLPMHIHQRRGEVKMLLRNPPAFIGDGSGMLGSAKAGLSDYNQYDQQIAQRAVEWLKAKAGRPQDKPWVLMVSLVAPHFPLTVPEKFFDLYRDKALQLPKAYKFGIDDSAHPYLQQYARTTGYNMHFQDEADVRRALCGYYGLVSYLDHHVGRLLTALEETGLDRDTRVAYLSDHGDNVGARGVWGKSTMYRESVGIPMIFSGPDVKACHEEEAAVSQIDIYSSVLDCVGCAPDASTASERSQSLFGELDRDRIVLSEYHTIGSRSAVFMAQDARSKYVYYCDHPPEFFDLVADPEEMINLAGRPEEQSRLAWWDAKLRSLCDPEQADARAKQRQSELIEFYGGEEAIRSGRGIGSYTPTPQN